MDVLVVDKAFEALSIANHPLKQGEYADCTFTNCDFSNAGLSKFVFSDCEFINCNLSMAALTKTALRNVRFIDCKMLGLNFENCNDFSLEMRFDRCAMDHSSFYKLNLKNTIFSHCKLREVDFAFCNLSGAVFDNCNLLGATFDDTMLEKTNFSTAINFQIDPEHNRIKKAIFSTHNLRGLLSKYDIRIED